MSLKNTFRLIRSRYPTVGILNTISEADDLEYIIALESWTNDRLSSELGNIFFMPKKEWVVGTPMATVIMAAFCHPNPAGGRFNNNTLGAWYAAFEFETAIKEIAHHINCELQEVGQYTSIQLREYLADFEGDYIDARASDWINLAIYDPNSYIESQKFSQQQRKNGATSIVYNSVRNNGANCIVCFKPKNIINVRQTMHYEIQWDSNNKPRVEQLLG